MKQSILIFLFKNIPFFVVLIGVLIHEYIITHFLVAFITGIYFTMTHRIIKEIMENVEQGDYNETI